MSPADPTTHSAHPTLIIKDIRHTYPGSQFTLSIPHLAFYLGDLTYIGGESGCGKSTLIKMLALENHPRAGEIQIFDKKISTLSDQECSDLRGGAITYIPQQGLGLKALTPVKNIQELLHNYDGMNWAEAAAHARAALLRVGLPEACFDRRIKKLSGGQRARVAIAKAYAAARPIVLADEILPALDAESRITVLRLFQDLASRGFMVIIIAHQPELKGYFHRVIEMRGGQIDHDDRNPNPISLQLSDNDFPEGIEPSLSRVVHPPVDLPPKPLATTTSKSGLTKAAQPPRPPSDDKPYSGDTLPLSALPWPPQTSRSIARPNDATRWGQEKSQPAPLPRPASRLVPIVKKKTSSKSTTPFSCVSNPVLLGTLILAITSLALFIVLRTGSASPQISTTIQLDDDRWQGGYRLMDGYGGRSATWVYGTATKYNAMQAAFTLDAQPTGAATLKVEGMDAEGAAKTMISISTVVIWEEQIGSEAIRASTHMRLAHA